MEAEVRELKEVQGAALLALNEQYMQAQVQ